MGLVTACIVLILVYSYLLAALSMTARSRPADPQAHRLRFIVLIPALNEEDVIGLTLSSVLASVGDYHIIVIDDASTDGTVDAVAPFLADDRVHLLTQPIELARRGKGAALNAGYAHLRRLGLDEPTAAGDLIVTVFDSDARVAPDFFERVSPYFEQANVAGVQSAVRMYNARAGLLSFWQHVEFAMWGAVFCRGKNALGTATLGGNGQCVRLSALDSMGTEPWQSSALTEDLDLSLRLLLNGWEMRFCPSVAVEQEAVTNLRRLVRQRARWMQGHFVCWQYLPRLLSSRLRWLSKVDLCVYLLMPVVFLPIGIVSLASWIQFGLHYGRWSGQAILTWYLLGFGIAPLAAVAFYRTERTSLARSIGHAHLFIFYSLVWFLATAVAFWNVVAGRRGWTKTSRARIGGASVVPALHGPPAYVAQYRDPLHREGDVGEARE